METLHLDGTDVPLNAPAKGFKVAATAYGLEMHEAIGESETVPAAERAMRFLWIGWLAVSDPLSFEEFEERFSLVLGFRELALLGTAMSALLPGKPKANGRKARAKQQA